MGLEGNVSRTTPPAVLEQYRDLSENMRHYANLRFAQLTIFVAITGALVGMIFGRDAEIAPALGFAVKVAGMLVGAAFLIMERSAADYWHHFRALAEELEQELPTRQYGGRPAHKYLSATNATAFLLCGAVGFWFLTLAVPEAFAQVR